MPRFSALRTVAALAALKAAVAPAQTIIYVDDDAPPGGDGHSWPTAFAELTDALAAAAAGAQAAEVRIAQGTYTPDQGTGDRARSFEVRAPNVGSGMTVWLRGAFGGLKAQDPDEIDFVQFATVLSGDLKGDDKPGFVNRADNSTQVLNISIDEPLNPRFMLSGLIVRGGWGDQVQSQGGGMSARVGFDKYGFDSESTIEDCIFTDNYATTGGGGAWFSSGRLELARCQFTNNRSSGRGGAIGVSGEVGLNLRESLVTGNSAAFGGGIATSADTQWISLSECSVLQNQATVQGGGIDALRGLNMYYCTIAENSSGGDGGGLHTLWLADLNCCLVAANTSGRDGGGVAAEPSFEARSCVFTGNLAAGRGGAGRASNDAYVFACTMVNNRAAEGGGLAVLGNGRSQFTSSIFWDNDAPLGPQALVASPSASLIVRYCDVQGGQSSIAAPEAVVDWQLSNLNTDPLFVSPGGADHDPFTWQDNDLHLAADSPCVDAGDLSDGQTDDDFDGFDRVVNANCDCTWAMDIGPYELQGTDCPPPSLRLFVNMAAAPGGDGLTWPTAFNDLQDALATPNVAEVWVASGLYKPDRGTLSRLMTFEMSCRIAFYGGFAGFEDELSQRDPALNLTVLSGDLNGDDGPGAENRNDNSVHVVRADSPDLVIDGFTITGGNADGLDGNDPWGGGIYWIGKNFLLQNCTFAENSAAVGGGGLYLDGWRGTIRHCTFAFNSVVSHYTEAYGGAAVIQGTQPIVTDCQFLNNKVDSPSVGRGGALSLESGDCLVASSVFRDNIVSASATAVGGALSVRNGAVSAVNCLFTGNSVVAQSEAVGGAMAVGPHSASNIVLSDVLDNIAVAASGNARIGGVAVGFAGFILANSILGGNTDASGSGESAQVGLTDEKASVDIEYSIVQGWTGAFGGQGNSGADPGFTDPLGPDGVPSTGDEDLSPSPYSAPIDAASRKFIPIDIPDLDGDGQQMEPLSLDLAGRPRFFDDYSVTDTGPGYRPIADIGAFERQRPSCLADCDPATGEGRLDIFDYLCFWGRFLEEDPSADCTGDNSFDLFDFLCFTNAFNAGC